MKKPILVLLLFLLPVVTMALETATFAGGCFWCMQGPFDQTPGVTKTVVGFAGGHVENPGYYQVVEGGTGHVEAIQVTYDPKKVSYEKLLEVFWHQIDPTDSGGQFADRGESYQTAIFYHNEAQKKAAEKSKAAIDKSKRFNRPVWTPIRKYKNFFAAGEKHQQYYKKSPEHYNRYKIGSGRAGFIKKYWKK